MNKIDKEDDLLLSEVLKGKLDDIDFMLQELNLKIGKILVHQEMFYDEIVLIKKQQETLNIKDDNNAD